jgi:hypothetical protein
LDILYSPGKEGKADGEYHGRAEDDFSPRASQSNPFGQDCPDGPVGRFNISIPSNLLFVN